MPSFLRPILAAYVADIQGGHSRRRGWLKSMSRGDGSWIKGKPAASSSATAAKIDIVIDARKGAERRRVRLPLASALYGTVCDCADSTALPQVAPGVHAEARSVHAPALGELWRRSKNFRLLGPDK